MSDSVWPHRWQPTRLPDPWDSPGKNTEVGCHFLLQCMKVKSQSEVAQSCLTLRNPMDCSLPGSPIHGIFQARVLEWGAISSVYSHHLFLISSVSIRSILSFIVPTFAWNVPLVSLIFLKRSLVSPILLFSCIVCVVRLGRLSYLSLLFFGTLHSYGYIFPFLLCLSLVFGSFLVGGVGSGGQVEVWGEELGWSEASHHFSRVWWDVTTAQMSVLRPKETQGCMVNSVVVGFGMTCRSWDHQCIQRALVEPEKLIHCA